MSPRMYQRIEAEIWAKNWTNDTRLLAFYVLTCKERTTEGLYRMPLEYAAVDLRLTLPKTRRAMVVLTDDGCVEYDPKASVVLIVNALERQAPRNPNGVTAALTKLRLVPPTNLRTKFYLLAQQHAPLLAQGIESEFGHQLQDWLSHPHSSQLNNSKKAGLASVPNGSANGETGLAGRAA